MIFGETDIPALLRRALPAVDEEKAVAEAAFMRRAGVKLLTRHTATLPPRLDGCPDAPRALFQAGDCRLDVPHVVSIVGTRRATVSGTEFCRRFVERLAELCPDTLVISGLAYGIDVAAHRAALEHGLPTAAVVAHGLDTIYPADHRDIAARIVKSGGAILSEYMSGARVHRSNFLARNRIVAGLSAAVIVVESAGHGGALYTARLAREYGREVFAVPGRWNDRASEGCNALIAAGRARLLTGADDFVDAMHWTTARRDTRPAEPTFDFTSLQGNSRLIANCLRANPEISRDELTTATGLTSGEISARLMEMELDDLLTVLPGGHFRLNF